MKHANKNKKPERMFWISFLAVCVALTFNYFFRYSAVPSLLRFVPADASMLIVTSSLKSLWESSEPHVSKFFKEVDEKEKEGDEEQELSPVLELAKNIKSLLKEKEIELKTVDDLREYGIDSDRGVVLASVGSQGGLLIVPVVNCSAFEGLLKKLEGEAAPEEPPLAIEGREYTVKMAAPPPLVIAGREYTVHTFGNGVSLVFPNLRTAVIVVGPDSLIRDALQDTGRNLNFYRNNDAFVQAISSIVPPDVHSGAWIKGYTQMAGAPWVDDLVASLCISPEYLKVRLRIKVNAGSVRPLQMLLTPPENKKQNIGNSIPAGSGAALIFRDPHIAHYLGLLRDIGLKEEMGGFFAVAVNEAKNLSSVEEFGLFVMGSREGLPDLAFKISMNQAEAEHFIFELQKQQKFERDKEIIDKALDVFNHDKRGPARISDMIRQGYLSPEKDSLWDRYTVDAGEVKLLGFQELDFDNDSYQRREDTYICEYILPPMTDNDFRYRPPVCFGLTEESLDKLRWEGIDANTFAKLEDMKDCKCTDEQHFISAVETRLGSEQTARYKSKILKRAKQLKEIDKEALRRDKYRLCGAYMLGGLVIGTDAETLRGLNKQGFGASVNPEFRDVYQLIGNNHDKGIIFINPNWVINQGLLNPDREVYAWFSRCLFDMDQYSSLLITLLPKEEENELFISAILLKN